MVAQRLVNFISLFGFITKNVRYLSGVGSSFD
jgi:hypothetical protein